MKRDLRERFGLDYLKSSPKNDPNQLNPLPPFLEESLLTYGRGVIERLSAKPGRTGQIFDLVDELAVSIDTLQPVANFLVSKGYLDVIQTDPKGNHTVKVTTAGSKLLAS